MSNRRDVDIDVKGLKEFVKAARKADDKDTLDAVKAANKDAAAMVATEAKRLVPRKTGRLAKSIRGTGSVRKGTVVAGRGNSVPYAAVIHFGWAAHGISPHPFIYDAVDKRRDEVYEAYEKQITQVVNKVAK